MKLYGYWLGLYPLDWEFCFMPVQTYKNFITEQYHKNPAFYSISAGSIEKVLAHIDVILSAAMEDWNNTTNHAALRCPPMICPLPKGQDSNTAEFAIILKMDIFIFPEESGLSFLFDVDEELTDDPAAMDAVGEMLDEAEELAEKAKAAIKAALADEDSPYHSVAAFFMEFHRDNVGPDIAAELFPGTGPSKLSIAEMVDFLRLKRFGSLVDSEMNQQVFILDLSFNPEITDELMVIYFDLNKEIFCITHES